MTKNCSHTFAVLAYKKSLYLEECILSLKRQTVESNRVIFTSTPSSFLMGLSQKYNIPVMINKNNEGIAADWNFAYNNTTSKYVTLAHQDDIYLPEYTEKCLSGAEKEDGESNLMIFTNYGELINNKIKSININLFIKRLLLWPFLFKKNIGSVTFKKILFALGTPIPCPSVMYHKDYIGDFDFYHEFECNMDWDAWLRLAERKGSFIHINKILMYHRDHKEAQTSMQIEKKIRQKEDELMFHRLWPGLLAKILARIYSLSTKIGRTK